MKNHCPITSLQKTGPYTLATLVDLLDAKASMMRIINMVITPSKKAIRFVIYLENIFDSIFHGLCEFVGMVVVLEGFFVELDFWLMYVTVRSFQRYFHETFATTFPKNLFHLSEN